MSPLEIHDAAIMIPSLEDRRRYLHQACQGDVTLLRRVEAMLAIDDGDEVQIPVPERFLPGWSAKKLTATLRWLKRD